MSKAIFIIYLFSLPLLASTQTVDFTFQSSNGLFCNPATIQFNQNCTGNPTGFIWNLGNGLKTVTANPSTSYTNAGKYTVKLIAIYPTGPLEIMKSITITPTIIPHIIFDRDYICQPGVINFSVASNGNIASYEWDFGDLTGIVTTPTNATGHSFSDFGTFTTILKATDATGCFGQDSVQIAVRQIPITAKDTPTSGCIPANVSFTSEVTLPLNSSVSNYSWDFDDGSPPSSTATGSTSHIYNSVGSYLPKLRITTDEGCTRTFNFPVSAYGTPPTNLVAYPEKTTLCGSESAVLVGKAINANSYLWDFGDSTSETVSDTIVRHEYETLGTKTVTVTPYFNNCAGNPASFTITIEGVIARFSNRNTCDDKGTFLFTYTGEGSRGNITWDFGDGSPTTTGTRPTHSFPLTGEFVTSITVIDAATSCLDTTSKPIYTATPTLVNPDMAICKNTGTTFSILNNYTNPAARYNWNILGKEISTRTLPEATINGDTLGSFNNFVVINNGPGFCRDTVLLNHSILVRGPFLDFNLTASSCFGDTVNITNNSRPFIPADTVRLWYWNYGNSLSNDTIYQPAPIQYNAPGTFKVELTGIDINGCKDSLRQTIIINTLPFLQVFPNADTLCSGQSDSLFAYHSDSILWSPASGLSCTTCDTVIANPSLPTKYMVTATTATNCSIQDSIDLKVIPPFTAVPSTGNQYICRNDNVTLDMDPKGKVIKWSPSADLSNSNIYNPIARPGQTTTYTATLTDSIGCFTSSADVTVFIKANPTVDAGPDKVVPYSTLFNLAPAYSNNVSTYSWTPITSLNCTTCASPAGIALNTETYEIKVTSDSGCVASDEVTIAIECKESNILMPKAFTPNNDNLNDYFYPITRGIKTIVKFAIFNREGKIIYEAGNFPPNSKTFGWDGNYQGKKQNVEAYVYIIEALCEFGEKLTKSGSVLLLR